MIRGYAEPPSVAAGDTLAVRISSDPAAFHIAVHRLGSADPPVALLGPLPGERYPDGRSDEPWDWPPYPLHTRTTWRSGVYVAHLHPCRGGAHDDCVPAEPPPADGRDARALFVVRRPPGAAPAPLLFKVGLATYHAYNATGGGSFYVGEGGGAEAGLRRVTLLRPGGGTGGDLSFPEAVDVYDPATPREGVAHWDLPFLRWLEECGYRYDVCADLDLDDDPHLLEGHAALVSAGHDEYWSEGTRHAVERFVHDGGSAAFFSGNLCFWRVSYDRAAGLLTCRHPPTATADCDQWWRLRSEVSLSGVSYRNGGGWWSGPRDPVGYRVVEAGHWVYEGTGLRDGDEFGAAERLVGYECDAAPLDLRDPERPRVAARSGDPRISLLGLARLGTGWQDRPNGERAAATMVVIRPGGVVFTAGTTDWPRLLASGHPVVGRITRNVLDRVRVPIRRLHVPATGEAGRTVDAWVDAERAATVEWTVSRGHVRGSGRRAVLTLPEGPGPLTISARIHEGGHDHFATATVEVLTDVEAAQVAVLRAIRHLAERTPPDPRPAEPPEPGNRALVDPGWDPLQDGLRRSLTELEAREIGAAAARLSDAVDLLCARLAEADGAGRGAPPAPDAPPAAGTVPP